MYTVYYIVTRLLYFCEREISIEVDMNRIYGWHCTVIHVLSILVIFWNTIISFIFHSMKSKGMKFVFDTAQ